MGFGERLARAAGGRGDRRPAPSSASSTPCSPRRSCGSRRSSARSPPPPTRSCASPAARSRPGWRASSPEWVAPDTPFFVGAAAVLVALGVLVAGRAYFVEEEEVEVATATPVAPGARRGRRLPARDRGHRRRGQARRRAWRGGRGRARARDRRRRRGGRRPRERARWPRAVLALPARAAARGGRRRRAVRSLHTLRRPRGRRASDPVADRRTRRSAQAVVVGRREVSGRSRARTCRRGRSVPARSSRSTEIDRRSVSPHRGIRAHAERTRRA